MPGTLFMRQGEALRAFKAGIFQALAHPTRIAVVDALRDGELAAGALGARIGVEQPNLSQHLAVLRTRKVLVTRKAGTQVFYALRDPILVDVLDLLRRYFRAQLNETRALLDDLNRDGSA